MSAFCRALSLASAIQAYHLFGSGTSENGCRFGERRGPTGGNDSGFTQVPTCQVIDSGDGSERLGRHRRLGCRRGRSATFGNRQRRINEYWRNGYYDDAADSGTDDVGKAGSDSESSQGLLSRDVKPVRASAVDRAPQTGHNIRVSDSPSSPSKPTRPAPRKPFERFATTL